MTRGPGSARVETAMGSFTAIPVGQGDAFLLRRSDGKTVLVDGGRSRKHLDKLMHLACPEVKEIDVVVCTHADADHADGLIGLLQAQRVCVSELWLPGQWSSRLLDLFERPCEFVGELVRDIDKFSEEPREHGEMEIEGTPLERIAELIDDEVRVKKDEKFDADALEAALEYEDRVEFDEVDKSTWDWCWEFKAEHCPRARGWVGGKCELWRDAIRTVERIRELAREAYQRVGVIRWFDFDEAKKQGQPNGGECFLKPLNSVELKPPFVRRKLGALEYLALSVANRRSLVFLAPETDRDSAVLFAADSDLAACDIPATTGRMLATAPHHGSEANKAAYDGLANRSEQIWWVRSDGAYRARPGETYRKQPHRVCTMCKRGMLGKQAAVLQDSTRGWERKGRGCVC